MGAGWREDPSNALLEFERVRLRAATDTLASLGLTAEMLALSAERLQRARSALDDATFDRVLHFIGRNPGISVGELLGILRITKQSLARVLSTLVEQGLVTQASGRADRRQRLLHLTEAGRALERRLFETQRYRLLAAFREAGGPAVDGFRRVLRAITGPSARARLDAESDRTGAR